MVASIGQASQFRCFYCQADNQTEAHLVGCVVQCASCGRSVIVPSPDAPPLQVLYPTSRDHGQRLAIVATFAAGGGFLPAAPTLVMGLILLRQVIGIGWPLVVLTTLVALLAGGLVGATIGWRLTAP